MLLFRVNLLKAVLGLAAAEEVGVGVVARVLELVWAVVVARVLELALAVVPEWVLVRG